MEAITRGTHDGICFLANIIAMLIVLVALVTLVNTASAFCRTAARPVHAAADFRLGFQPLLWLIGIPSAEIDTAARLMGTKTVINEFVAYLDLAQLAARCLEPALATDHDLCALRLCQFRQRSGS